MISYLLPTRNRPKALSSTLTALAAMAAHDAEVIVVDNASEPAAAPPAKLDNGLPVRGLRREANEGASARNHGAHAARGDWLVMLDDDSHPLDEGHVEVLAETPPDVAAVGAEIRLPDGRREAGGLPEVIVGCGAAVRREAFLAAGGYDPSFGFYAEEYDLCAQLLLAGHRVVHDLRFKVVHHKIADGRDKNLIVRNLVRNNGWVMQRYAPVHRREPELCEIIARYGEIALKEKAAWGYSEGMCELHRTKTTQPSRAMGDELFDRFTGRAQVRAALGSCLEPDAGARVGIVAEGKNACVVRQVLGERGARIVDDERHADLLVIGTLSPGPMLDALDRYSAVGRVPICPWFPAGVETPVAAGAA